MKQIIDPQKHKAIVVTVAAVVCYGGYQALSAIIAAYQPQLFLSTAFYIYLFLLFWQTVVFDLHLKDTHSWHSLEDSLWHAAKRRFHYLAHGRHWLHFQNYLILPGVIYWATVSVIYLNPFSDVIKQLFVLASTAALIANFWYLKTIFYSHHESGPAVRQTLFLIKLYASFTAFAGALGISRHFGYGAGWFALVSFCLTLLLIYQALFQHHYVGFRILKFLLGSSFLMSLLAFAVYIMWNVNYFSGALAMAAVYNTVWGVIHHQYIDKNLNRETIYEYLAVLFFVLVVILGSTNFAERI